MFERISNSVRQVGLHLEPHPWPAELLAVRQRLERLIDPRGLLGGNACSGSRPLHTAKDEEERIFIDLITSDRKLDASRDGSK